MKTLQKMSLVLFVLCCFAWNTAMAVENPTFKSPKEQLRQEIIELVEMPEGYDLRGETELEVKFLVTSEHKIVVLDVDTDSRFLEEYMKSSLNYQSVDVNDISVNTPYRVKVVFVQK